MDNFQPQPAVSLPLSEQLTKFLETHLIIYQFLRFGCIGFLNTALNFLILNAISKAAGVNQGWQLGEVAAIAFACASVQSYLWNRTWTFGSEQGVTLIKNVTRLLTVGLLGGISVVFVFIASKFSAPAASYAAALIAYLVFESTLWKRFGFHVSDWNHEGHSFVIFFIITLVGWGINVSLISVISQNLHITNSDLDKNIAAALATAVSLFWNFVGYKMVVFKK